MKRGFRPFGSYSPIDQLIKGPDRPEKRHGKVTATYRHAGSRRSALAQDSDGPSFSAYSQAIRTSSSSSTSIPQLMSSSGSTESAPWSKKSKTSKPDGHGILDRLSSNHHSSNDSEDDDDDDACSVKSREMSPKNEIIDIFTSSFDETMTQKSNGMSEIIPSSQVTLLDEEPAREEPIILIEDEPSQGPPLCPLCKTKLQNNILSQFFDKDGDKWTQKCKDPKDRNTFGPRLCLAHRRQSSLDLGISRDYPRDFDKNTLAERVSRILPSIRKVILGKVNSRFTKKAYRFASSLQGRPSRLFILQQSASKFKLGAGYYGPQGASLITQIIFDEAGKDLERAAHFNDWIAKLTTERYVYIVLVPHVASSLIIEDYKVKKNQDIDEKKAAKILEQSYPYGCAAFPNEDEEEEGGDGSESIENNDRDNNYKSQDEDDVYNELLSSEI